MTKTPQRQARRSTLNTPEDYTVQTEGLEDPQVTPKRRCHQAPAFGPPA